jgi:hypothetical protein
MQPLISANTYGTNTDISDRTPQEGLGSITRSIDAYNTSIGIFRYSSLNITCSNKNGFFNDTGNFFTFKRDLAKVEVLFFDKTGTSYANYRGVVNEAGTRTGVNNNTITFLVTARETILGKVKVDSGDITATDSFSDGIKQILNKTAITSVIGYDAGKINVAYDGTIDSVAALADISTKEALDLLLQASNSIFYIDSDDDMVVSSRDASSNTISFYGAQDIYGRDNIIQLFNYTGGYHRIYNSVIVIDSLGSTLREDATSIDNFGLKQIEYTFDFLANSSTRIAIAEAIRDEFKDRKKECSIKVESSEIRNINVLDKVIIDLIASNYNNIDITTSQTWKIIGLTEYPSNYTADIFLREI